MELGGTLALSGQPPGTANTQPDGERRPDNSLGDAIEKMSIVLVTAT